MKGLMRFAVVAGLLAGFNFEVNASDVVIDGKAWRQPLETAAISWRDMSFVCDYSGSGACSGSVLGVDVDGWTFASSQEVTDLLAGLGVPIAHNSNVSVIDSVWAPIVLGKFSYTGTDPNGAKSVWGVTRDYYIDYSCDDFGCAEVSHPTAYGIMDGPAGEVDAGSFDAPVSENMHEPNFGVWMYRAAPAPVPIPGGLLLLAPALLALRVRRSVDASNPS